MTVLARPDALHRHTPSGSRLTYVLRTPTVPDRARLRYVLRMMGARPVDSAVLVGSLRAGIRAVAGDAAEVEGQLRVLDDYDAVCEEIGAASTALLGVTDAAAAAQIRADKGLDELEAQRRALFDQVREIEAIVEEVYPAYRAHVAMQALAGELIPLAALRLLLRQIENLEGGPLKRLGQGEVAEEELGRLPEAHLAEVGAIALDLFQPTGIQEKNS